MRRNDRSLPVPASITDSAAGMEWRAHRLDEADSVWQREPPDAAQDPDSRKADA